MLDICYWWLIWCRLPVGNQGTWIVLLQLFFHYRLCFRYIRPKFGTIDRCIISGCIDLWSSSQSLMKIAIIVLRNVLTSSTCSCNLRSPPLISCALHRELVWYVYPSCFMEEELWCFRRPLAFVWCFCLGLSFCFDASTVLDTCMVPNILTIAFTELYLLLISCPCLGTFKICSLSQL